MADSQRWMPVVAVLGAIGLISTILGSVVFLWFDGPQAWPLFSMPFAVLLGPWIGARLIQRSG